MASASAYRFQVALSFPSEHRGRVERIANILATRLERERILYDHWYRAEFARPNLDEYLLNLYHRQSRLLVFFFSRKHSSKQWTGLEWRVGKDLLKKKQNERLMLLRLDKSKIPALFSTDGYIDIWNLTDEEVAADILARLSLLAPPPRPSIEEVVNDLRAQVKADIVERCGKIRVLSMEKSIDLGGVYTDVLILPKRTANVLKSKDELMADAQLENFERVGLSSAPTVRMPGYQVFDSNDQRRIIIYGKPGAGKTTFLKHMATQCAQGAFCPDRVSVFITLREFADSSHASTLFQFIKNQWRQNTNSLSILNHGHALILLDGLDEVRDRDFRRVRQAIETFALEFPLCLIALTCRIAAREYLFVNFTEVEMADFNNEQIAIFASRWFRAYNEDKKASAFTDKLVANKPVWELATSPLLLTLLCLIFQERGEFDGSRSDLYKQGLDILLHKWDAKRDIDRDFPSGVRRSTIEPLLAEIAYSRFLIGEYFFDQASLETQIKEFFQKRYLTPEADDVEPGQVLNSIEAYLGLLVARAMNVYSFSHLTFQEYLTALQVVRKPTLLYHIGPHIGNPHWREVWLLLAAMLDADDIVLEIKAAVDLLVEKNSDVQKLLEWCSKKAENITGHERAALRAFYYGLFLARNRPIETKRHDKRPPSKPIDLATDLDFKLARDLNFDISFEFELDRHLTLALNLADDLALNRGLDSGLASKVADHKDLKRGDERALIHSLNRILQFSHSVPSLSREVRTLREEIPESCQKEWIKQALPAWYSRLQAALKRCGLDHDWLVDARQMQLLEHYYRANLLLMETMDEARGLTRETRQYVENTILLPYAQIPPPPT